VLAGALDMYGERDAQRPHFTRIVTPWRKFLGDNPDAVYFSAPVRADRAYRIRGNTVGAVYTSFTVEGGNADGRYPTRVVSALNDDEMQIAADGTTRSSSRRSASRATGCASSPTPGRSRRATTSRTRRRRRPIPSCAFRSRSSRWRAQAPRRGRTMRSSPSACVGWRTSCAA
jgi:hypothetical protein